MKVPLARLAGPLIGLALFLPPRPAPLWNRFGALVFGRGEAFYNFRGLHQC